MSLLMGKLATIFLVSVVLQGATGTTCDYTYAGIQLTTTCSWGCCYHYSYPCCDPPLYANPIFIVPISIGAFIVIVATIVAIILAVRRRRPAYGSVMQAPHTTGPYGGANPNVVYYSPGYPTNSPGYPNPPVYSAQPTNETTHMNPATTPYTPAPSYGSLPTKQ